MNPGPPGFLLVGKSFTELVVSPVLYLFRILLFGDLTELRALPLMKSHEYEKGFAS